MPHTVTHHQTWGGGAIQYFSAGPIPGQSILATVTIRLLDTQAAEHTIALALGRGREVDLATIAAATRILTTSDTFLATVPAMAWNQGKGVMLVISLSPFIQIPDGPRWLQVAAQNSNALSDVNMVVEALSLSNREYRALYGYVPRVVTIIPEKPGMEPIPAIPLAEEAWHR